MLRNAVRERAANVCEYCRLPEWLCEFRFVVDHIVARQHRGPTELANLALCCPFCNYHKGPNASGVLETGEVIRLFHPRTDTWSKHFYWAAGLVMPRSTVGQVTIEVLAMNHPEQVSLRTSFVREGKLRLDEE